MCITEGVYIKMTLNKELANVIKNHENNSSNDWQAKAFRLLHEKYSLISLNDGFGDNKLKAPTEKGWSKWCKEKNPNLPTSKDRCGLCTGPVNGILVLDVDNLEKFKAFCESKGILCKFETFTVQTGKGWHLYFQYPSDGRDYGNLSREKDGFDVRGVGGYVLAPGSRHPETKTVYEVVNPAEVAPAPQWLLNLYTDQSQQAAVQHPETSTLENTLSLRQPSPEEIAALEKKLKTLPVEQQKLIKEGKPKGERSEASMKVMVYLLSHGFSPKEVQHIYAAFPIGEKARENFKWFEKELERAEKYVAANQVHKKEVYECVTAESIINSDVELNFLIEDFLPENGQLILHGKSGTFKTHLVLQLIVSLLNEKESLFLNKFKINNDVRPQHILILNGENSKADIKSKLLMIETDIDDECIKKIVKRIHFISRNGFVTFCDSFDNRIFINELHKNIAKEKINLLVIDNLQCFSTRVENENEQMRQVLNKITEIAVVHNLTVILVHHSGKGDATELRGASSIKDWATNVIAIEENKDHYILHNTKSRSSKKFESMKLYFDGKRLVPSGNDAGNSLDIITEVLKEAGGAVKSQDEFINLIKKYLDKHNLNMSINKIKKLIEDAVNDGKVITKKGNANATQYSIQ